MPIVKKGGTIILAASLSEGLGSPEFQQLMKENRDLKAFIKRILETDYFIMDQWQLEELAKVVNHCKVKVVTDGLSDEMLRHCLCRTGGERRTSGRRFAEGIWAGA